MAHKYESKEARLALAREIAGEAMVLLKNEDGLLPLAAGSSLALVGLTQLDAVIGGGGSGASFTKDTLQIRDELKEAGFRLAAGLDAFYEQLDRERKAAGVSKTPDYANFATLITSGEIYELFGKYTPPEEEPLPGEELFAAAAGETDTALLVLGRLTGGEEGDRHVEGDYTLTPSEIALVERTCAHFSKVAVVFDACGLMDFAWMDRYPQIKAALFMGPSGEQAAGALADLLTGKITPSGKLVQTAATSYEAIPTAEHFTCSRDDPAAVKTYADYGLDAAANGSMGKDLSPVTVYGEDIYVGYRYYDSFEKPVQYPFGYGLSYASFAWEAAGCAVENGKFTVKAKVTNTSSRFAGKEVLQVYVHAPFGKLKKPWQELRAFGKTDLLAPGAAQELALSFDLADLASFDEEKGEYILEPGEYKVLVGEHSRSTRPVAALQVGETLITRKVTADIGFAAPNRGKIALLAPEKELPVKGATVLPCFVIEEQDLVVCWPAYTPYDFSLPAVPSTLADVRDGKVRMEEFIAQMTVEELAVLCNGYGTGLPFMGFGVKDAPVTLQYLDGTDIGANDNPDAQPGYCNPALAKYGIPTTVYRDGPASVGETAWPTGMMLASTFNPALVYEFGSACGYEAAAKHIDSWLAPGVNLIRNPVQGRAFEYFSEDPLVCGVMATQVTLGAMVNNPLTVCPKHFALNEQETYRRGSAKKNIDAVDSIVSARAARELYLRPFERVLTQARPTMLMSSFNKLNGAFAAGNAVLCREILREEWGFDGVVVTDWGDMDFVVDGADAVHAGNDVVMPGGPPVIAQVLQGYEEGRVTLDDMREAAAHLMNYLLATRFF